METNTRLDLHLLQTLGVVENEGAEKIGVSPAHGEVSIGLGTVADDVGGDVMYFDFPVGSILDKCFHTADRKFAAF